METCPERSRRNGKWRGVAAVILLLAPLFLLSAVDARVGGGQSFSGGRGGGGGVGGDAGALVYFLIRLLIDLNIYYPAIGIPVDIVILLAIIYFVASHNNAPRPYSSRATTFSEPAYIPSRAATARQTSPMQLSARFEELRRYDPNFSEILFTDFVYALYARVQEARGRKDLDSYSSYLDARVIQQLQRLGGAGLRDVTGVIIGASRIVGGSDPAQPTVTIAVSFETNYTEVYGANGTAETANTWYAREQWDFTRQRDLLSRPPEKITALHCPKCGGALEKKPDGSCAFCGVKIVGGDFDWFVTDVRITEREPRGPLLTRDVPEEGTDFPTVFQPNYTAARERFMQLNPDFSWRQMEARMRHIFVELQLAWTNLQWERARPYETDNVFQTHLFWITEYQRQRLRNVLKEPHIEQIVPVKVTMDAFYDAIAVRIFASMIDYTADAQGKVVSGNPRRPRRFSEYWTFIRRRGVKPSDKDNTACPNCGAPLKINMAGVCEYCGGKITSGEFDWVLSRIEQDEAYQG